MIKYIIEYNCVKRRTEKMPDGQIPKSKSSKKKEMAIVLIVSLVIVIVASVFIIDYFHKTKIGKCLFLCSLLCTFARNNE